MKGKILVLDGVSTNRIMLKVQLGAAWYDVVQGDRLEGIEKLLRRTRPDLILTAMSLPDGNAVELRKLLQGEADLADIPVIAITAQNDRTARLRALEAGIDDVIGQPYDDAMLLARIRSLLRCHGRSDGLHEGRPEMGLSEPAAHFDVPRTAEIALITDSADTGALWRNWLAPHSRHRIALHRADRVLKMLNRESPDAVVVEIDRTGSGLRLLADLRARALTRNAALIAVAPAGDGTLAAEALDRGADDVMSLGFGAEELALRLETQLRRKARADGMRNSVREGLRAAVRDPMTGLHNRRYAAPAVHSLLREAHAKGQVLAFMLADLDYFKRINDSFGHAAGDTVLIETSRRMTSLLADGALAARVGGEEFLLAQPVQTSAMAEQLASDLCHAIECRPFLLPARGQPLSVTMSVGLVVTDHLVEDPPEALLARLMDQADRALYAAKGSGRNRVSRALPAA
ncbi:diguanylate cyclase domain-containing protein [Lutimaribacter marinistellae]|uniref:diguanylate cyclase n=1 Tax=Lutimaribacter marinistellae TaxID=1820329 RepID=A0ABV7TJF3_9RHOB